MNRGVSGCAATALLLFVSLDCEMAAAAETTESDERGFYLGASVSRVEQDARGEGQIIIGIGGPIGFGTALRPSQVDVDDTDAGWSMTLGYKINRYLAAEFAYYNFGEVSVAERYVTTGRPIPLDLTLRSNIEAYGPGVSLLGTLPVTSSLDIFVRGGVLFLDQEIATGSGVRNSRQTGDEIWMAGAGVQWSFATRWTTRLEYQLTGETDRNAYTLSPGAGTNDLEQLSLGVLFDF